MFNFKSAGQKMGSKGTKPSDFSVYTPQIGIKTPLSYGKDGDICDMHTDPRDQLKDNLRCLILTNHGDRLGLYDFGSDLKPILFEYTNSPQRFVEEATKRIGESIQKWISSCNLESVVLVPLTSQEISSQRISGLTLVKLGVKINSPKARMGDIYLEVMLHTGG